MAEFPSLGTHCSHKGCGQLDFLPAKCEFCQSTFCTWHLSPSVHNCQELGRVRPVPAEHAPSALALPSFVCQLEECGTAESVEIRCPRCGKCFCLKHRSEIDHRCDNIQGSQSADRSAKKSVQTPATKPVSFGVKTPSNPKNQALAVKLAVMKLKQRATGDTTLPETERIYFSLKIPDSETDHAIFVDKEWPVGKLIDVLATRFKLKNENNVAGGKKLRLLGVEQQRRWPVEEKVGHVLETSDGQLWNGCAIELRYCDV